MSGRKLKESHTRNVRRIKKEISATAAAELIGSNEDLLTEILIRLPAKPLYKFKTISKSWLRLISSPHFAMLWKPKPGFIVKDTRDNRYVFVSLNDGRKSRRTSIGQPLKPLLEDQDVQILHASNGLLLCWGDRMTYFVCNPLTRRRTILPMFRHKCYYMYIVADLALNSDNNTNARYFKVISVYIYYKDSIKKVGVEVYSSDKGYWSLCPHTIDDKHGDINFTLGVVWNSKLHWPSYHSDVSPYFDATKECFGSMPMPPLDQRSTYNFRNIEFFGESGDRLYLMDTRYQSRFLVIFEMKKDSYTWVEKPALEYRHFYSNEMKVVGFVRGEIEHDSALVIFYRFNYLNKDTKGVKRNIAVLLKTNGRKTKVRWNILSENSGHASVTHEHLQPGFVQQYIEKPSSDVVLSETVKT